MGLFDRLNTRALSVTDVFGTSDPGLGTYTGKRVSPERSLTYSAVYSAATLIADAIGGLTPQAWREDPETEKREHLKLPQFVRKPHPSLNRPEVFNQLLLSALLWGNGYAMVARRPADNVPVALHVVRPERVQCEWDPRRPGYRRYRVNTTKEDGYAAKWGPWLDEYDVLHLAGPMLPGSPVGLSVIAQARESIGLGLTLEEFGSRFFSQGSQIRGVIQAPEGSAFDKDKADWMMRTFERNHRGAKNWHRPAFLFGGAEFKSITVPPEDAQFLESREFQALDVARWFRVPPHRIGIVSKQSSWGSGLAEENTAMLQHTFRPWILRLEAALTAYAPGPDELGVQIKLDDSVLLRGSFKEMVESWSAAVTGQIATPNEARRALGLNPIEGGDKLVAPRRDRDSRRRGGFDQDQDNDDRPPTRPTNTPDDEEGEE